MWFATLDGLNKYDGYVFQVYRPEAQEAHSLSHRQIRSIVEDRDGILWIGTDGGGLSRFDRGTGQFDTFRHQDGDPYSLSSDFVTVVFVDRQGEIWVSTIEGLNRYDRENGYFVRYRHDPLNEHSLSGDQVLSIFEDSLGNLWVGTDTAGLNLYDRTLGNFVHYRNIPGDPNSLSGDTVRCIYEDRWGTLWVGTGSGLNRYIHSSDKFVRYTYDPRDPYGLSSNDVTAIFEDSLGAFWIGTYGGGLNRFDREQGRFQHYRTNASTPGSLSSDYVLSIYEDRTGVLWIGTNGGGLNKVERLAPRFQRVSVTDNDIAGSVNGLNNDIVRAIYEDSTGALWIGTNGGGLNRWDRESGTWVHFQHDSDNHQSLSSDVVNAIVEDQVGTLWIGTERGGLNRFDPESGGFFRYRHDEDDPSSLSDDTVLSLLVDSAGELWIGTRGGGLDRLDRINEGFFHYMPADRGGSGERVPYVRAIYEDREGLLWFGVGNSGLYSLDRATEHIIRFVVSTAEDELARYIVMSIFEDRDGIMWVGTFGDGLIRYDRSLGSFSHYREANGLPNDIVYGILEDEWGYLWLSTNNGLSRFDPERLSFVNYDVDDGLQSSEFNPGAYALGLDGLMYFGGIHGFNYFDPGNIGEGNPYKPSVVLTSLTQGGRSLDIDGAVDDLENLTLRWPENGFEFEFVALSYIRSEQNQYAYILEGFDREWNNIGSKRYGRYTNLPGGDYTLRLKASNNDGVWNEEGASLEISVVPPVWEMWWFQVGVTLLLLFALVGGYRMRVRSVEARSRALESQVAERTLQLSTMNRLLENEINERKRVEDELAQRAAEAAVAAERSRLARELHDAVTQTLFSASLIAEALPNSFERDPQEGRELLEELRHLSRGALAEMRSLLLELRPASLVEARLEDLLRQLAEAAAGRDDLSIDVCVDGEGTLPSDVHITLYRIAQESLNNVLKHARASKVDIRLCYRSSPDGGSPDETSKAVSLRIKDDGRGFNPAVIPAGHIGLTIMHERAQAIGASLEVESKPGEGTLVAVNWENASGEEETENEP